MGSGTVLGVFRIVVPMRESVREMFAASQAVEGTCRRPHLAVDGGHSDRGDMPMARDRFEQTLRHDKTLRKARRQLD
jgi:hypothetical protein